MEPPIKSIRVEWKDRVYRFDVDPRTTIDEFTAIVAQWFNIDVTKIRLTNLRMSGKPTTSTVEEIIRDGDPMIVVNILRRMPTVTIAICTEHRSRDRHRYRVLDGPRPRKKLLIIGINQTIYDPATPVDQIGAVDCRPYLIEFCTLAYRYFDICLWSAVKMHYLIRNVNAMGIVDDRLHFKICALLSESAMVNYNNTLCCCWVQEQKVKSIEAIWEIFYHYSSMNTLLVDDQKSNIACQPKNALQVTPYVYTDHRTDKELEKLSRYISFLGETQESISTFKHKRWRKHPSVKLMHQ